MIFGVRSDLVEFAEKLKLFSGKTVEIHEIWIDEGERKSRVLDNVEFVNLPMSEMLKMRWGASKSSRHIYTKTLARGYRWSSGNLNFEFVTVGVNLLLFQIHKFLFSVSWNIKYRLNIRVHCVLKFVHIILYL